MTSRFLPETQSLNLTRRKHQTNSDWETSYQRTGLCSSNVETVRNSEAQALPQMKGTQEPRCLCALCDRGLGPGQTTTSEPGLWRRHRHCIRARSPDLGQRLSKRVFPCFWRYTLKYSGLQGRDVSCSRMAPKNTYTYMQVRAHAPKEGDQNSPRGEAGQRVHRSSRVHS